MNTDLTRIPFELATDAELIICAHGAGISESRSAGLIDNNSLTPKERASVISFVRRCGYKSIQVDPQRRVYNPNSMTEYDVALAKKDDANLDARHRPDRKATLAFLRGLGLNLVEYVHGGSRDVLTALYACEKRSAQKFIRRLLTRRQETCLERYATIGDLRLGFAYPHTKGSAARRSYFIDVADSTGLMLGQIELTVFDGATTTAHIKFTNYAD